MEAGSGVRTHAGTAAPRGYKHKQSRRYVGFSTKCDVTLMRRSQAGGEPRAEAELNRLQVHGGRFRKETPGSVSEAGSSQGQAIHLQPDFCTVLCLRPTQPWVYSHLPVLFHSRLLRGMPALPHFRTGSFSSSVQTEFRVSLLDEAVWNDVQPRCILLPLTCRSEHSHHSFHTQNLCLILVNRNRIPLAGLRAGKVEAGHSFSLVLFQGARLSPLSTRAHSAPHARPTAWQWPGKCLVSKGVRE